MVNEGKAKKMPGLDRLSGEDRKDEFVQGGRRQETHGQKRPEKEAHLALNGHGTRAERRFTEIPRTRVYHRVHDDEILIRASFYFTENQLQKIKDAAKAIRGGNMSKVMQDLIDNNL